MPRQHMAFHGVIQLPPSAHNKTPCKAQSPEPETAATPVPCPDLPGRISPACPGSVSVGAEGQLLAEGQASCPLVPLPKRGSHRGAMKAPSVRPVGRGAAAARSLRPRRKIQY